MAEVARRLDDPALKIELINESDDPIVTPQDTPLYRHLEAAIKQRHPDAIVTPMLIPYGTDSNAFRPRGVKSYGIFPAIIPAETAASMHGDSERVPLASVVEASQVLFDALRSTRWRNNEDARDISPPESTETQRTSVSRCLLCGCLSIGGSVFSLLFLCELVVPL